MAIILALLPDPTARTRLSRAVGGGDSSEIHAEIRFAQNWPDMHLLAHDSAPQLVLFDPYSSGNLELEACSAFHTAFPAITLFAYGSLVGRDAPHDTLLLARAGVHSVAIRNVDDEPHRFRHLLTEALSDGVVWEVVHALDDILDPETALLMRYLLTEANGALTPDKAARYCHRCPKTLRAHLRRAGLPPINKLIIWARLFRAAHLLRSGARTAENVALLTGFSSRSAFYNQLRRYADTTPTGLTRQRDALCVLIGEFRNCCVSGVRESRGDRTSP